MIKRLVTMVTSACLTMAGLVTVTTLAVPAAASAATTRSASQAASILAGQIRPTAESTGGTDVAPAVSCYGGAVNVAFVDTGEFGPYTTTSRCRDINMRTTNGTYTYACVVFVAHTRDCNYVTLLGPSWTTIATDVKDGTRFTVPVASLVVGGYVTAQIAF